MIVSIIVAVAKNGVIGVGGDLPWHLSEDLKYFKAVTMGKPIVMGRKTFDSIGRPLPGRRNIVISRNEKLHLEGAEVVSSLSDAIALVGGVEEVMIIGGAQIYAHALLQADRVYLTEVDMKPKGDAYFSAINPDDWQEVSRRHVEAVGDGPAHDYVLLERR